MANKKITDLVEITSAANVDVLPIVDVSADITNKIKVENLPISTATQTALDAKQETLVSGTNIKTINSTSILGSGDVAVQPTLVSGTNIKTINSTSLLGSGDIAISANPAGTAGQIQFSDGSAFAADSNLFWNNTAKRLGVGTSSPGDTLEVQGISRFRNVRIGDASNQSITDASRTTSITLSSGVGVSTYTAITPTAQLHVKGTGATSATTSLLVQNSSGTELLKVQDDGAFKSSAGTNQYIENNSSYFLVKNSSEYHDTSLFALRFSYASMVLGGSTANASSVLDVQSTTRGFLPPRMTTTQKNAISTPAAGLMVYDTTTNKLCCYNGTTWNDLF